MTANERYEKAWNDFLVLLNRDSKSILSDFLRKRSVNVRGMRNWMIDNNLCVQTAKKQIRALQKEALKESVSVCTSSSGSTGAVFVPVEMPVPEHPQDLLSGISFDFPDGTHISIKTGSAKAVMSLMKLYQKEELLCLE